MCVQNLNCIALPVPEITGGTRKNFGSPWIHPCSLFSKIFNGRLSTAALSCFKYPLLSQERIKLRTSNLAGTFAHIHTAHRAVIFAIAQLSC